ncbi:hypothetical protein PIB30_021422 [Stylosanthes scabra]|uniref:Replication protein A 70 kDa DNA-binding subunit B/D first OB fold domain-containing protein n=1 Tax=Stylosanthes scabra TaxID=79078 RepID=A0ABU6U828_9FABA|nr:hypothetical protein [Stylosanthes scabra]
MGRYDFIENIDLKKVNFKDASSIEIVLQDIKGGRIQASFPCSIFDKHDNSVEEINMYVIRNLILQNKKLKTRATDQKWILTFSNTTDVEPIERPSFFRDLDAYLMTETFA